MDKELQYMMFAFLYYFLCTVPASPSLPIYLILKHVSVCLFPGQSVVAPLETGYGSLHEVFALWASPSITYQPLQVTSFTRSSLAQAMALALDDEVRGKKQGRIIQR